MAEWVEPKTDWHGTTDEEGIYTGDRFNAEDFNRIKNNLQYLRDFSIDMYAEYSINDLGLDRSPGDYFYADEINDLEENLETIVKNTTKYSYGTPPIYTANGIVIDFNELNRLESAILDLRMKLSNQSEGRRCFTWNFGRRGGLFG
nr:MAG TPA: hypothetical protein [Caudoviricetes sp.]